MGSMMNKARDFLGWGAPDADDFDDYADTTVADYSDYSDSPADVVTFPAYDEEKATAMPVRPQTFDGDARPAEIFRIETVHPTSFNDARSIGEFFRKGIPVVVNLTDLPEDEARRVLDFIAGLAFGLEGSAGRVTNRVFLLTPKDVEVTDHAGRDRVFR